MCIRDSTYRSTGCIVDEQTLNEELARINKMCGYEDDWMNEQVSLQIFDLSWMYADGNNFLDLVQPLCK